ncbi:dihydrouridine synthase DuS [Denitrovibrio acetiphilus DSM 12809]|uniref:tRNA-dihydrouridine synthase n=2 Tax=Denitrovibrio TaxID=117999 RepID=D4H0R5_DENA2|nr:dihydrouridine synthase DuS [Denitrovibrio acetiphilus DSM 12809]
MTECSKSTNRILRILNKNKLIAAPLAGVTTPPFRKLLRKYFDGLIYTEMVSVEGVRRKADRTLSYLSITESDQPIGVQLFGSKPEAYTEAIEVVQDYIKAEFVDINMGCPVKKVLKSGSGCAMMKDPVNSGKIVAAAKKALGDVPLTVKIRLGWDKKNLNYNEMIKIAYEEGAEAVTVHGRTKTEMFSGVVNYDLIADAKANAKLPIIGNGDVVDVATYEKMLATGVDGVMIGRGMMKQPWLFESILNGRDPSGYMTYDKLYELIKELVRNEKIYKGEMFFLETVKKYIVWFLKGMPGAAALRNKLYMCPTETEMFVMLDEYFGRLGQSTMCSISDDAVG